MVCVKYASYKNNLFVEVKRKKTTAYLKFQFPMSMIIAQFVWSTPWSFNQSSVGGSTCNAVLHHIEGHINV